MSSQLRLRISQLFLMCRDLRFASYMPTITATLGFSTKITLLLTFPPWAFATLYALANSWNSDRTGDKFWHVAGAYGFPLLGYVVALSGMISKNSFKMFIFLSIFPLAKSVAGKYISLFGMCMGYSGLSLPSFSW